MDSITFIASSGLITLIGSISYFIYIEFYRIPQLNYEILPTYIIEDEKIVPVIFRNEGHANATNVRIKINCSGPIQNLFEDIPEKFLTDVDNQNVLIYQLDRFTKSLKSTIYIKMSSLSEKPINNIDITSDQGTGQEYKKLTPLSLWERIALIMISFSLGMLTTIMLIYYTIISSKP